MFFTFVVQPNNTTGKPTLLDLNIIGHMDYSINIIPTKQSNIVIISKDYPGNKDHIIVDKSFNELDLIDEHKYTLSLKNNSEFQNISNSSIINSSQKKTIEIHVPFYYIINITYDHPFNLAITKNKDIVFESASLSIKKNKNSFQKDEGIIIAPKIADEKIFIEGFFAAVEVTDFKIPLRICNFYLAPKYWINSDHNSGNVTLDFSDDLQVLSPNRTPLEAAAFFLTTMNLTKVRIQLFQNQQINQKKA